MTAVVFVAFLIWVVVAIIRRDELARVRAEMGALRLRVATLEETVAAAAADAAPRPAPAPPAPPPAAAPAERSWEAWLPTGQPVDVPPPEPPPPPRTEGAWDWGPPAADANDETAAPAPWEQPIAAATVRERADWERWIGTHLLAIGGGAFLLLGAAFFVKLAIADGWLTPGRQVALAVLGGIVAAILAVRTHDADDPARNLLGQALAAAGAGSVVVGLVAGARIYDTQVVSTPAALIGTGFAAAFMVACAWRWHAQATAALGITTALLAPPLVGATASLGSAAFVAVALLAAGFVTVRRAWPWLVHAGLWLTVWQLAWWLVDQTDRFAEGTAPVGLTLGVIGAITGWWLLVAGPALLTERAGGWRVPPATAIISASSAAVLIGGVVLAIDQQPESWPVRLLGLTLVAVHGLCAAALWRRARPAALLLVALGGGIAALTIAALAGPAGQAVFWSIEAVALLALARRERDPQVALAAVVAYVLAIGQALLVVPPDVLAVGTAEPARALIVGLAATAALLAGLRVGRPRRALPWVVGGIAAAAWTVQAVTVSLAAAHPGGTTVEQPVQLIATGALTALALAVVAVLGRLVPDGSRQPVALLAGTLVGIKAVGDLALAPQATAVAIGLPVLVAGLIVLGVAGGRGRRELRGLLAGLHVPSAVLPAAVVAALALTAYLTPDALAVGTTRLAASLGLWAALTAALVAGAALPGGGRRMAVGTLAAWRRGDGALTLALLAMTAMAGVAVAVLTAVASHPGTYPVDQDGQVLVTVLLAGWWLILAELARSGALAGRVLGAPLSGLVPVAGWAIAVKAVAVDALALGPHGPALGYAAAALAGAALVTLYRPPATGGDWPDGVPMITGLAVLGAIMAGSDAIVAGSDDATRAVFSLATAAGLGLACAIRHRGPRDVRRLLVVGAILTGVLAESVAVVTLLTPHTGTVDRSAQLGLSIAWAATAIALIAVGLVARGELASTARRSGIPLLGVAIAKVLLYDTARLSIGQRAGLFLAIGGLLLVGAYLYARLVALTRDDAAGSERPAAA